eukprot:COSAG02_NODE_1791_length_10920_cov_62.356067_1_plen_45_part_10
MPVLIEYGANSRASGLAVPIHHAGAAIATRTRRRARGGARAPPGR